MAITPGSSYNGGSNGHSDVQDGVMLGGSKPDRGLEPLIFDGAIRNP